MLCFWADGWLSVNDLPKIQFQGGISALNGKLYLAAGNPMANVPTCSYDAATGTPSQCQYPDTMIQQALCMVADTWALLNRAPKLRMGRNRGQLGTAAVNGHVYVCGGSESGDPAPVISTMEQYDTITGTMSMADKCSCFRLW